MFLSKGMAKIRITFLYVFTGTTTRTSTVLQLWAMVGIS